MTQWMREQIIGMIDRIDGSIDMKSCTSARHEWWHYPIHGVRFRVRKVAGADRNFMMRISGREWSIDVRGRVLWRERNKGIPTKQQYRVTRINGPREQLEEDIVMLSLSI